MDNTKERDMEILNNMENITGMKYSEEQKDILLHRGGMCILACAGSGKTTVLTHLLAKRIQTYEIPNPSTLLCTTYSKSGADEMEQRLGLLLDTLGMRQKIAVKTMHSLYLGVLKDFGYPSTVVDIATRRKFLSEACRENEIFLDEEDFTTLDSLISYQVNNLLSDADLVRSYAYTLDSVSLDEYTSIRKAFASKKIQAKLVDFDDMQLYMYSLMYGQGRQDIVDYCCSKWTDIYVDEAQDMSRIQYMILKKIIKNPDNLVIIGDDDQCLIEGTEIETERGIKKIEDIDCWEKIKSSTGRDGCDYRTVDNKSKKHINEDIAVIKTASGKELKGTLNHVGFAKIVATDRHYYTYLMYSNKIGFRIGTTSGIRVGNRGEMRNGIDMRLMQERADKIWILKVCNTREETLYFEALYAYKYNIPMYRFVASEHGTAKTSLSIEDIKKLHSELNTFNRGMKLLKELGLDYEYPHRVPQAEGERCKISLSMLGSIDKDKYGVSKSETSVNTNNSKYVEIIEKYLRVIDRKSTTKYNYKNGRKTHSDIDEHERVIKQIQSECIDSGIYLEVDRTARLGNEKYNFMALGNMVEGMVIPVVNESGEVVPDEIVEISREAYNGYVYDLSVPVTRNFVANGVVVHNCIYQWRGADPSIILNVCAEYDIQRFVLSTNYRCAGEIVKRAAIGIKFNSKRSDKEMQPFNEGGSIRVCDCGSSNLYTMSKYAYKHIRRLVVDENKKPEQVAVLSRNNSHLSILSNMLFKDGIHCESTNEMKMTRSVAYRNIRDIIELATNGYNGNITENNLYKVCMYMKKADSKRIGKIQSDSGVKLSTIIGYIATKYWKRTDIDWNEKVKIPGLAEATISQFISYIRNDTIESLVLVYKLLTDDDTTKRVTGLLALYLTATEFQYRDKPDKKRSVEGLVDYISDLIRTMGFNETRQFLKVSEQYEEGKMAIPGTKICMSTMHNSKGKEWDNVVLFADDNITFPSFGGIVSQLKSGVAMSDIYYGIDENRRLHYVAMTRARKDLAIFTDNKNVGLYMLEALGVFDYGAGNNAHIVSMATEGEVYADLIKESNKVVFGDESEYKYDIDILDMVANIEIDYLYRGNDKQQTVSIDDIQTTSPQKYTD